MNEPQVIECSWQKTAKPVVVRPVDPRLIKWVIRV